MVEPGAICCHMVTIAWLSALAIRRDPAWVDHQLYVELRANLTDPGLGSLPCHVHQSRDQ